MSMDIFKANGRQRNGERLFLFLRRHSIMTLTGVLVLALFLLALVIPGPLVQFSHGINAWIYKYFGWFYLLLVLGMLLGSVALAVSPWGSLRLGKPNEKPAFDNISWFAMLFCAGMGTGFLFWGGAEPLLHFQNPPLVTGLPKEQALALTYFHWGLSPWAIYALTAVAIGYFCNRRGLPLQFSRFLNCNKPWQRLVVDGFMILALIFGIAATFGMGVLMIEEGLASLLPVSEGAVLKIGIIVAMTVLFLVSAYRGLSKGIRFLSNTSLTLTCLLLLLIFILIPKDGLLERFVTSIAFYFQGLSGWSLGFGDFHPGNWPQTWTVKYWSWWLAWAPFVGSFIALISKGRSIRQVLIGSIIAPTMFSVVWFFVMGGAAIGWIESLQGIGANPPISFSDAESVWFGMLDHYTHSLPLALFSIMMVGVFVCDSLDSASFTLSCLSRYPDPEIQLESSESKVACEQCGLEVMLAHSVKEDPETGENSAMPEEGPFIYTFCWGVLLCLLTAALLLSGGIDILQEVTPIMVLPFSLLLVMVLGRFIYELPQSASEQENVTLSLAALPPKPTCELHSCQMNR
ncbi:MAG: BCCT family transporter [Vampirovibrionales bacterium]|nr:BCCT family transporter [Vampirovibrionales bacterium]